MPETFVVDDGWVIELPVPEEAIWTVCPETEFPLASFAVSEIVDAYVPLATTLVVGGAVAVDSESLIVETSALKPTVCCSTPRSSDLPGLMVAVIVFV